MKKFLPVLVLLICMALLVTVISLHSQQKPDQAAASGQNLSSEASVSVMETDVTLGGETSLAPTDFAVRLFQTGDKAGENTLLSPISALYALGSAANGAQGETLSQIEGVLGMSVAELNDYLYTYIASLPKEEAYQLYLANAIWFKEDETFTVEEPFLQTVASYYGAGLYQASFDEGTLNAINDWVSENTDGKIARILEKIPEDAVMYLVNALAFDAQWQKPYREDQVQAGTFTREDGTEQPAELMYAQENQYLEDDGATGFLKDYADGTYAFVALLPKEGVTVEDYVSSLTGKHLAALLAEPEDTAVNAAVPKFQLEDSAQLKDVLISQGITNAFDSDKADFSALGHSETGNLFISRIIQKTFLAVNALGTQAGASTAVEVSQESAEETPPKEVILDRPFLYLIIGKEARLPLFMGTLMDLEGLAEGTDA